MCSSTVLPGEKVHEILDSIPAIIWSADPRTLAFTYVNRAAESILGYPKDQWLAERDFWPRHIHPDDRSVVETCQRQVAAGNNHELVYRMIAADGHHVWLRDQVRVIVTDGEVTDTFGAMFDISTEQTTLEDLARSEQNYRRLVDSLPDAVGVHVNGRYIYVNPQFVKLFAASSADDLIGRDVMSLVDPRYRNKVKDRHKELKQGRTVPVIRQHITRFDGRTGEVEVMALPVVFNGTPAVQVVARDITNRIQTEERLALLAAGTNEAIWDANLETGEFWSNVTYRELFGTHTTVNAAGEAWLARIGPEARECMAGRFRDRRDTVIHWSDEYRVRTDDGSWVWVLDRGRSILDENGKPSRLIGALLDVTDKHLLNRRLEDERRIASLGHLAATIAHEFNNVLMSIQPFAEILIRSSPRNEQSANAHRHITEAVARGKRVTSEILHYANPKEPNPQIVDAGEKLAMIVASLQQTLPPSYVLELEVRSSAQLLCDPYDLEHVITNFVTNARDAMDGGGVITIELDADTDSWRERAALPPGIEYARISVADTGCGISAAALPSIFEPLYTTKRSGTGLGLPIAKKLVERQNGAILVDTVEGEGTTIHIFLPLAK